MKNIRNYYLDLFLIACFLTAINDVSAQQKTLQFKLNGIWKVTDYQFFLNLNIEDKQLLIEKRKEKLKCLNAKFIINGASMKVEPHGTCNFIPCDTLKLSAITVIHKLPDSLYYKYPGEELVEYNMVSQEFLDLLGITDNQIRIIDTKCFCENGDYTLKIIIVNLNKIVLFSGVDITVLERNPRLAEASDCTRVKKR